MIDSVQEILLLSPSSPYFSPIFTSFKLIWRTVPKLQTNQQQFQALAYSIAELLQTLESEHRAQRMSKESTCAPLDALRKLLNEISSFILNLKEANKDFLGSLLTKNSRDAQIEVYHRKICSSVTTFDLSLTLNTKEWQSRSDDARRTDEQTLSNRLSDIEADDDRLGKVLDLGNNDPTPIMVSLQKRLDDRSNDDREYQFFLHVLQYLIAFLGFEVEVESWMITSHEVELGHRIGVGGFGEVYKGIWNKADVAIKIFRTECGITPSSAAIRKEIEVWSQMRHPNILQFLGANEWGDRPFIVMPYLANGNAREYVQAHPDCNRLRIIHQISLGLVYLHAQKTVHGDLKALNVLIDDGGNALLCDFGLSRIRADVTSRTATPNARGTAGSRNWMAPELLLGGTPKKPSDIYAFAMTTYEVLVNETPLDHMNYNDFIELVGRQEIRPQRPDDEDAPSLSDSMWELTEQCWVKEPRKRPTAKVVSHTISQILEMSTVAQAASQTLIQLQYPVQSTPSVADLAMSIDHFIPDKTIHGSPVLSLGGTAKLSPNSTTDPVYLRQLVDQNSSLKKEASIAERKLLACNKRIQNLEALLQDLNRQLLVQSQKFEAQLQAVKDRLDQARAGRNAAALPPLTFGRIAKPLRGGDAAAVSVASPTPVAGSGASANPLFRLQSEEGGAKRASWFFNSQ